MENIILANKQRGETMGELTARVRREQSLATIDKITFAGRLDPMAEGLVVFLAGDRRLDREQFLALDKEYTFDVLMGVETDTGDVLGVVTNSKECAPVEKTVRNTLESLTGEQTFLYPAYSSKPVEGKPLYQHAREGTLDELERPRKNSFIHSLAMEQAKVIDKGILEKRVLENIELVRGDFRQTEIRDKWLKFFAGAPSKFSGYSFKASVSSGTYIRTLAQEIAARAGCIGLADNIVRTRIGGYKL